MSSDVALPAKVRPLYTVLVIFSNVSVYVVNAVYWIKLPMFYLLRWRHWSIGGVYGFSANHFSSQKTRLNDLSYGIKICTDLSSVLSLCTRLTDGQTDSFFLTRPPCIQRSAVKMSISLKADTHYRAAWNATRSYDEISVRLSVYLSVCLSVCLSVKRVHCDKTAERYVYIFISYERSFILVF